MSLYQEEINRVKQLLGEMGRGAKKALGQNFLVNSQKIQSILLQAKDFEPSMVVEIGPGLGALTRGLLKQHESVQLIEMDNEFVTYWQDQGAKVVQADALQLDWSTLGLKDAVLVSNLPYQISARLVVERCVNPNGLVAMVLMFQKEVAQRLTALQKHKEHYGLLTVVAQSFWNIRTLEELGPNDFYPPPKVASRVLVFTKKEDAQWQHSQTFLKFARHCFSQRRKMLKKNLSALRDKNMVEAIMNELQLPLTCRPEDLSLTDYWRLFERFRK